MSIQRHTPSKLKLFANTAFLENNERVSQTTKKINKFEESQQISEYSAKNEFDGQILSDSKQNEQITNREMQILQKKLGQKKTESELWKQKYENQINQILTIKSNFEKDQKQYQKEIKSLQEYNQELQKFPQEQKRISFDNNDNQNKKMKYLIESRNDDIIKLQEQQLDDDNEIKRLLDDNQQLRKTIANIDLEKQREIGDLEKRFLQQESQLFDNYQMDHLEREIQQLHKLLEVKNDEIENILGDNLSQKDIYESEIERVKNQLERQICDVKFNARDDLNQFELQMGEIHRKEIIRINFKFENQLSEIEKENIKLREILDYHNLSTSQLQQQINQQCKELDQKNMKLIEVESLKTRMQMDLDEKLRKIQQQMTSDHQRDNERESIILQQQKDIEELSMAIQYIGDERNQIEVQTILVTIYQDFNQTYKIEIEQLKLRIYEIELDKNKEVELFQKQIDNIEAYNRDRIRQFSLQIENYDLEVKRAKEIIDTKSNEIDNLLIQLNLMERENRRSKDEIDDLRAELIHQENLKTQVIDMKSNIDMEAYKQIDSLKKMFNTQITNLNAENREIKLQNERKTLELHEANQKLIDIMRRSSGEQRNRNLY